MRTNSSNTRPTRSASLPLTVISLPRTRISESPNAVSTSRSNSSRSPRSSTMRWFPGTRTLTGVGDTCASQITRWSSTGGPFHAPASEDVEMEVGNGVLGVVAHVEHEPVAVAFQALDAGHTLSHLEHLGQDPAVFGAHRVGRLDVHLGHDEHVAGKGGLDVAEGVGALGGRHLLGRHVSGHDLAKEAVAHRDDGRPPGLRSHGWRIRR